MATATKTKKTIVTRTVTQDELAFYRCDTAMRLYAANMYTPGMAMKQADSLINNMLEGGWFTISNQSDPINKNYSLPEEDVAYWRAEVAIGVRATRLQRSPKDAMREADALIQAFLDKKWFVIEEPKEQINRDCKEEK